MEPIKKTMENMTTSTEEAENERPADGQCITCQGLIEPKLISQSFLNRKPRWYDPDKQCEPCQRREELKARNRERSEAERARLESVFKAARVSPAFRQRTFDTFRPSPASQAAFETAKSYTPEKRGLLFYGPCGVGKTHLASAIANKHAETQPFLFISCPELLNAIRSGFDSDRKIDMLEVAKQAPFLIVDDIGAEKPTEWVRETLYLLVEYRSEYHLPTIFTTNCTLKELSAQLGDRIASRITGMCQRVKLEGQDYRVTANR